MSNVFTFVFKFPEGKVNGELSNEEIIYVLSINACDKVVKISDSIEVSGLVQITIGVTPLTETFGTIRLKDFKEDAVSEFEFYLSDTHTKLGTSEREQDRVA